MTPRHPAVEADADRLDAALYALWAGDPGPLARLELSDDPALPALGPILAEWIRMAQEQADSPRPPGG